ncbi:MAG: hypothetical protein ACJ72N_21995 [Labedaea sp.]
MSSNLEDVLDVALSMIDQRRWGLRAQLVALVRLEARADPEGVAWLSRPRAERLLRCGERYAYRLLRELVSERVLELVLKGAGSRPSAYRLNPDVERWAVPWREADREFRRARLALARAPGRAANGVSAARSHIAQESPLAARSLGAQEAPLAARQGVAHLTRRQLRDLDRAGSRPPSTTEGAVPPDGDGEQVSLERARRITEAIENRTGRPVYGSLAGRVRHLAGVAELGAMLEAIAAAPVEFQPPLLVDHLERVAAGRAPEPGRPGTPPRLVTLDREADYLRRQIAVIEADEEWRRDETELEELRRRLAECQNAMDQEVGIA